MEKKERLDSQRGAGEGQRRRKERLESNIPDKETVIIRAVIMDGSRPTPGSEPRLNSPGCGAIAIISLPSQATFTGDLLLRRPGSSW